LKKRVIFAAALAAMCSLAVAIAAKGAPPPEQNATEVAVEPVVAPRSTAGDALETLEATPGIEVADPNAPAAEIDDVAAPVEEPVRSRAAKRATVRKTPARPTTAEPPMWRLVDADSEIYIVGTFHALPKDLDWRSDALVRAADMAETVVFEAEVDTPRAQRRAQEIVARSGRNRPGVTLSKILGPDDAARFVSAASGLGIDPAALEPARPWQAFLALSIKFLMNEGFDPAAGVEQAMLAEARIRGRNLRFFETIDQQLDLFAGMSAQQEKLLLETILQEWDNQADDVQAMLAAWRKGDLDTIDALMNGPMRDSAPDVYDRLIVSRNTAWADRTEELLAGSGKALIAVGAAHLAGGDSLPAMLAARGHAIERWPAVEASKRR
jgi:hypothetical protein